MVASVIAKNAISHALEYGTQTRAAQEGTILYHHIIDDSATRVGLERDTRLVITVKIRSNFDRRHIADGNALQPEVVQVSYSGISYEDSGCCGVINTVARRPSRVGDGEISELDMVLVLYHDGGQNGTSWCCRPVDDRLGPLTVGAEHDGLARNA
ncbi:hypothetical protein [Streptomyces sp. NPDC007205]|uniref:hypothetical protein n=1 Tax=Streptomyces sp. NPDC007205 TaxID=3154316 RepID=UPI0033EAAABB